MPRPSDYPKSCSRIDIDKARQIVRSFAEKHELTDALPALDEVRGYIFTDQRALCRYLTDQEHELGPFPPGLIATTIENRILIVSQDEVRRLRPEFIRIKNGWHKIIAHEMTHILHLTLVDGDSDALGPEWFFEGLACFAAQQTFDISFETETPQQVLEAVQQRDRQRYGRYEAAIRYFCRRRSLREMIDRAKHPKFEEWLLTG